MHSGNVTTPFGRRPMTLDIMKRQFTAAEKTLGCAVDKWKVFRDICEARQTLGLQDRALAVLNALLSFLPESELSTERMLIVFPSNAQLSLRAHGICSRTLRRAVAALVDAGIIERHDSPNGKRYAHRDRKGEIEQAFGFNLMPLVTRAAEFARLANEVCEARLRLKQVRDRLTLCRRDIRKLLTLINEGAATFTARLEDCLATLPRAPALTQLDQIVSDLQSLKAEIIKHLKNQLDCTNLSANEGQDVRHKEESESESIIESEQRTDNSASLEAADEETPPSIKTARDNKLPLSLVLKACPDIKLCAPNGDIRTWQDLRSAALLARSMLGIGAENYQKCCKFMGTENTIITLACLLQKGPQVQSPGAYFRDLTNRAERDGFSPAPMVMALLKTQHKEHMM